LKDFTDFLPNLLHPPNHPQRGLVFSTTPQAADFEDLKDFTDESRDDS
jgi:hypothetical protein